MRYTNKHVLALRDDANKLLADIGCQDVLVLTISQSFFQIWTRSNNKEIMIVGHSTIDETYRWFEGFVLAMSYNHFRPNLNDINNRVKGLNVPEKSFKGKVLSIFKLG